MNEKHNETENKTKMGCLPSPRSCLWSNLVFWSMWHYDVKKAKLIMLTSSK